MKFQAHVEEYWNEVSGRNQWYWHVRPYDTQDPDDYVDGSTDDLEEARTAVQTAARQRKAEEEPTIIDWEFEL
jgi:hypothetical protein